MLFAVGRSYRLPKNTMLECSRDVSFVMWMCTLRYLDGGNVVFPLCMKT